MTTAEAIAFLSSQAPVPAQGLPEELFLFASGITPLVNVDLLVQDGQGRTLLAWRSDHYSGTGWHVPGGIVRFKERLETRVQKVAECELGSRVTFDPKPVAINQLIHPSRNARGHFLSLLYFCCLPDGFEIANPDRTPSDPGYLQWHEVCPPNLVYCHEIYRPLICPAPRKSP
jgi:colanic acid biosynthesis protein WcaH